MKLSLTHSLILLACILISCNKVKEAGHKVKEAGKNTVQKAKHKVKKVAERQVQKVVDVVFPPFDSDKPDTENNKIRFRDFIQVELTPDIKNIYCYDEAIGIDATYKFSFNCSPATSKKIIEKHNLIQDTIYVQGDVEFSRDFFWWDSNKISKLPKYNWSNGESYFKSYWYDPLEQKGYFLDFDM
ncbi:hypothetical protein [Xanthocytophaga agilis]|uniref:Lipoprotein n=1 Tax=Xanthocytophaga agilis TaxID=3048010 RepID=A0AAE3R289_9BACT|nr:hypothetical protein [Xanthocytophaga agilis]MDJ1500262.1 hypothetical protein [Xanthocytophaga agilis]